MKNKRSGFILIFTFVFLGLMVLLTEQLLRSVFVSSSFTKAMHNREHAKMAALGGLNMAIAQLSMHDYISDVKQNSDVDKNKEVKLFLEKILPHLNKWQVFSLDEKKDGVAMQVQICITCEDGKLNINNFFDFENQTMRKETAGLLKGLMIKGKLPAGAIYTKLEEFFMQRKKKVHDISEFYEIPEFKALDIFYRPPMIPELKTQKYESNKTLALQDVFTIWSSGQLDAMMLSDGVCALFGLRRPLANDAEIMKDKFNQIATTFNPNLYTNSDQLWNFLEPLYEKKPRFPAELQGLFSKQFGPMVYSVLSYGKVGEVEQRLLAIVKRIVDSADHQVDKADKSDTSGTTAAQKMQGVTNKNNTQKKPIFRVVRLYWL